MHCDFITKLISSQVIFDRPHPALLGLLQLNQKIRKANSKSWLVVGDRAAAEEIFYELGLTIK